MGSGWRHVLQFDSSTAARSCHPHAGILTQRGRDAEAQRDVGRISPPILGNRRGDALRASCAAMHRRAETAFRPPPHDCARPPAFPPDRESCSAAWENKESYPPLGLPKISLTAEGGFPICGGRLKAVRRG